MRRQAIETQPRNAQEVENTRPKAAGDVALMERPADSLSTTETVPGGRFVVNGRLVDANGNPLED